MVASFFLWLKSQVLPSTKAIARALKVRSRLANTYPHEKMEQACEKGLSLQVYSYRLIESILKRKTNKPAKPESLDLYSGTHENVRGSIYYK